MKRARGKKPEEINLAPASSSAAQNGKHQKRFILCSPVISLKSSIGSGGIEKERS